MEILITGFVITVFAAGTFLLFSKTGKALTLGGKIVRTVQNDKHPDKFFSSAIQVHVIQPPVGKPFITIQMSASGLRARSMLPYSMSRDEAKQLIALLSEAVQ